MKREVKVAIPWVERHETDYILNVARKDNGIPDDVKFEKWIDFDGFTDSEAVYRAVWVD